MDKKILSIPEDQDALKLLSFINEHEQEWLLSFDSGKPRHVEIESQHPICREKLIRLYHEWTDR